MMYRRLNRSSLRVSQPALAQTTLHCLFAGLLLCITIAPASASDSAPNSADGFYADPIQFGFRAGAWVPQTRTNQKTDNTADNRINFDNLDVNPDNAFAVGEIDVTLFVRHRLRAEYWDSTSSGKKFLANNVTFNGTLFPAGSTVQSSVELSALKMGYELLLVNQKDFRLGLGGGAMVFSSKSKIKLTSGATQSRREDERTIWFLSGDLAVKLAFLEIFANVDTLSYGKAALLDARAGLALNFDLPSVGPAVALGVGADWRLWDARINDDDLDAQWTVQGLELFAFLRF